MKLYTDQTKTSFFKTDHHVKNLQPIEINSIREFIVIHDLDPLILLGSHHWLVSRFDELKVGNLSLDQSDEPEAIGEALDIDFTQGMELIEILFQILKNHPLQGLHQLMEVIQDESLFFEITEQEFPSKTNFIIKDRITSDMILLTAHDHGPADLHLTINTKIRSNSIPK